MKGRLDRLDEACAVVTSLLRNDRTTFTGEHYALVDAPLEPKPIQSRLPLLIGGGGEKRTLKIAARWADEWNVWGDPALLAHKGSVLAQHCEQIGRDPAEIAHSACAMLILSDDVAWLDRQRTRDFGRPAIVGTPAEVVDIVAAYTAAGVDELLLPDFTMPDPGRKRATYDLFINEVAPHVR